MSTPQHFTAARIAACLGVTPQAVRKALRGVKPSTQVLCGGNLTAAYSLESISAPMLADLNAAAARLGVRDALALLTRPPRRFKDEIPPLAQIVDAEIDYANKLQRALRRSLTRADAGEISAAQFEADGVADYRREFGKAVSARQFRNLCRRVWDRDGGNGEWNRLEIYLPEHIHTKRPADVSAEHVARFTEIEDAISGSGNPTAPNEDETRAIWLAAFQCVDRLAGEGLGRGQAERQVRAFLFGRASFLAPTREAMLKAFSRKLERYLTDNRDAAALLDGRKDNTGNHDGYEVPEPDVEIILHRAVWKHGGEARPAWTELHAGRELSDVTICHYPDAWNIPRKVMDLIAPELPLLSLLHRSKRDFNMRKGYVTRSYEGIPSLFCYQADDVTLDCYCWIPGTDGRPRLIRPQTLFTIDFRSMRIIGRASLPRPQYTSFDIFAATEEVLAAHGFPKLFYWERGLWEKSKVLKGETDPLSLTEISQGFREFGIEFQHAIGPRAKIIERVIGFIQRLLRGEPGYCGRERSEPIESFYQQKRLVESGKVEPGKYFYSFDEWDRRVGELVEHYNATPQHGRIHGGKTPDEVFEACMDLADPVVKFDERIRYLLSTHRRECAMTERGVTFRLNGKPYNYRGEQAAHLIGQRVLVWFNVQNPEFATVTDLQRSPASAVCVELSKQANALEQFTGIGAGTLASELSKVEGQVSHIKARYHAIKSKFARPERKNLVAPEIVELGARMAEQNRVITEGKRHREKAQRSAARHAIALPANARPDGDTADAIAGIASYLPGATETDASPAATAPKIYVLKDPPAASIPQLRAQFWALWNQIEKLKPGTSRHAITNKALGGYVKPVKEMSAEELARVVRVFSAIVRDARKESTE